MPQDTTLLQERNARGAAALENTANSSTPPLPKRARKNRREVRYDLRKTLWEASNLDRLRHCGRTRSGAQVGVRSTGGAAGFSGLQSCGSVWACPVCSAKVMARRSEELGAGLQAWERQGGKIVLGTLTLRHHKGHSLSKQWDALASAWSKIGKTRVWKKHLERLGSPGLVRVVEPTHGDRHGWHAHLHFVLLIGGDAADLVPDFRDWLIQKWCRVLVDEGFPGSLAVGQDVHLVEGKNGAEEVSKYVSKISALEAPEAIGREVFGSWTKTARDEWSTRSTWAIAQEFKETGDMRLLDLWHEFEKASKGRRQSTWSRGLRDFLGLDKEKTDEEIAEEEIGDEDLVLLDAEAWDKVLSMPWPTSKLLDVMETKGPEGLKAFLTANGINWTEPGKP